MSKHDAARRLKTLVRRECNLARLEKENAISLAKFRKELETVHTAVNEQQQCLHQATKQVNTLTQCNELLREFLQEETRLLAEKESKNTALLAEVQSWIATQEKQRHDLRQEMDKLRFIKESSQTFFNWRTIGEFVQGFTVCETDTSTHLVPFKLKPAEYKQDEMHQHLWHETQKAHQSAQKQVWAQLFFGDFSQDVLRGELRSPGLQLKTAENDCIVID